MITLEEGISLLKGEHFHAVSIYGFSDFGWSVILTDHEGEEYTAYEVALEEAIINAWVKWAGRIKDDENLFNPDGDKTD